MPTPFIMPKMDMDQETVTINEWLKKEGDQVEKGEPVVVIETDKITSVVDAPAAGRLAGIKYGDDEEAPVTQVIAYILQEGETEADLPEDQEEKPEKTEPTGQKPVKQDESTLTTEKPSKSKPTTPVAARMAEAEEIDLSQVPSTGEKITKEDLEAYLDGLDGVKPRVKTSATPAARRIAEEKGIALNKVEGSGPRGRVQAADVRAYSPAGTTEGSVQPIPGQTIQLKGMRKRIAQRMTKSYQSAPHIYLTVTVDMTEAENSRERMNKLAEEQGGVKISLTAYLVRVVAWALKRHPYLNAGLEREEIQLWKDLHIGIATALEDGLIVPVIHHAGDKSAREINECLRQLTRKARSGDLEREEIQGGTFTISNLGMFGIESFTAIINPPQSAILAVGAIKRQPIVVDDQDTLAVRPMMKLTLAADHRVVDGAVAAQFLADLVRALETPELLIY
jgi:pyruvate dehydrogenase E2 component (dihydrolipoamide acetyltransferase)